MPNTTKTIARTPMNTGLAACLLILQAVGLTGCAAPNLQPVKVAVPVPCQQTVPTRPAMPTEALASGTSLDAFIAAAIAEIERREGYEGELRAALDACVSTGNLARPD